MAPEQQTDCLSRRFSFSKPAPVSRAKNRPQGQEQAASRDAHCMKKNVNAQVGDAVLAGPQQESLSPSSN